MHKCVTAWRAHDSGIKAVNNGMWTMTVSGFPWMRWLHRSIPCAVYCRIVRFFGQPYSSPPSYWQGSWQADWMGKPTLHLAWFESNRIWSLPASHECGAMALSFDALHGAQASFSGQTYSKTPSRRCSRWDSRWTPKWFLLYHVRTLQSSK